MKNYTKADFTSDQEVRWCPGCGDYAILSSVQKIMPELGIPRENIVFISGIGCSGRFPYYMNTYGFHTIHGRAPAVATGLKLTRPELSVWIVTGDGDGLSIGGNHLMHILRRNIDVKILLFNNRVYGLTKGQYSPTSEVGQKTPTTPQGSIDRPLDPVSFALIAGASFVARAMDVDAKNLQAILKAMAMHSGSAFLEIYQNCNIFNDGVFASLTDKQTREDHVLWLEPGQPFVYGKNRDQHLVLEGTHDPQNLPLALQLANIRHPVPMGIFRCVQHPTYEQILKAKMNGAYQGEEAFEKLLKAGQTWEV